MWFHSPVLTHKYWFDINVSILPGQRLHLCFLCAWKIFTERSLFYIFLAEALATLLPKCFHCLYFILFGCNKTNEGRCFSSYRGKLTGMGTLNSPGSITCPVMLSPFIFCWSIFQCIILYNHNNAGKWSDYWEVIKKTKKLTLVKTWILVFVLLLIILWPQTSS